MLPSNHFADLMNSFQRFSALLLMVAMAMGSGCNTLASLGIGTGSSNNRMLQSATDISQAHGYPEPLPKELSESVLAQYYLEPGDVLLIEPARFDSTIRLPGDQPVQPDGSINLGAYGRIQVAGQTIEGVQATIQSMIQAKEKDCGPITVRLVDWQSKKFYVLGEVNSPGSYQLDGDETVLDALVEAGGVTRSGNAHKIILSRPTPEGNCRIVLPVCYHQIVQLGDTGTNYQLQPGDRIFVPSLTFMEDLKLSLCPSSEVPCPKCNGPQVGCNVSGDCNTGNCNTGCVVQ